MADENKAQLLDGLYRSRDVLIGNVKELSQQIRQFNLGAVLFLLIFTALIFNESFKPTSWENASEALKTWKTNHGTNIKFLSSVSYRHFGQSTDSTFLHNRQTILKSIKGKVSTTNVMSSYQRQLNKGFTISNLTTLKNELDTLYKAQNQIEQYTEERSRIVTLLDSLQQNTTNDSLGIAAKTQQMEDLKQSLPEYDKQLKEDTDLLNARFASLKKQYPKIKLLLINDELNNRKKIDTIQSALLAFEKDKEVVAWQDIKNSHPASLKWPYKTWQILNNDKVVNGWRQVFKNLNYEDSLGVMKKVKLDSSFVFNHANIQAYIESQRKNKLQVPTTEFFGTKIPLPTKQILVILPLLMMALVLALQVLGLQRRAAEIRMAKVENHIKRELNDQELVRTHIYGEEVMNSTSNIALLFRFQFTRLFENNTDAYKDIIFNFANVMLAFFLGSKWIALIKNDPKIRFWAFSVLIVGGALFLFVYIINWRMSRNVLNKVRELE